MEWRCHVAMPRNKQMECECHVAVYMEWGCHVAMSGYNESALSDICMESGCLVVVLGYSQTEWLCVIAVPLIRKQLSIETYSSSVFYLCCVVILLDPCMSDRQMGTSTHPLSLSFCLCHSMCLLVLYLPFFCIRQVDRHLNTPFPCLY